MLSVPPMPKPSPSEWGKINAGQAYGILSVDLGRALFGVPWGKYQLPLVYYAIENSWGIARTKRRESAWPDPEPFKLNINALATQWNMPRQRLYEARDWLLAAKFLMQDDDGFWINKDAHEWVNPDTLEPLLSPSMMIYAASARSRSDRSDKQPSVTPERDTMSRSSGTCTTETESACNGTALHGVTVQRDTMSRSSVTSHIEEPARDLDLEISRVKQQQPAKVLPAVPDGPPDPAMMPPYPDPERTPIDIKSGKHTLTEADARDVFERVWKLTGVAKICFGFYEDQRRHSAATWRAAITEAAKRGKRVGSVGYLHTIAGDVEKGVIRPEPQPAPAKPVEYFDHKKHLESLR